MPLNRIVTISGPFTIPRLKMLFFPARNRGEKSVLAQRSGSMEVAKGPKIVTTRWRGIGFSNKGPEP